MPVLQQKDWWKSCVVYQIYPASFKDTTGSGVGDLNGITLKLDHIQSLGADVVWLCPIYKSPLADMGYDISDYEDIDERYGTLGDWDRLLFNIHERGMKLMFSVSQICHYYMLTLALDYRMDLVVNHTSDQHKWFLESKSSKTNPKRDWYIWRPPKYDEKGNPQPPNNWKSVFQGSAWQYDEATDEYYLHLYLPGQPDLNWENPGVRQAVWEVMRYWIRRGCDGFRMDVINLISKADGLPDAPITAPDEIYQPAFNLFANGPHVHDFLREMHDKVLSKHDLITVGETPFTHNTSDIAKYVLPSRNELQMVFQFEFMDIDIPDGTSEPLRWRKPRVKEIAGVLERWQCLQVDEGFWNAVYTENHDQARSVSRFGTDSTLEYREKSAKLLAILQISQSGTQYVYQGQELGLKNAPHDWGIDEFKDVATQNFWKRILLERMDKEGKKEEEVDMSDVMDGIRKKSRDHARLPMQWDPTPNAGFSPPGAIPWMRVHDEYPIWNAAAQVNNLESVFSFWKTALQFRKAHGALVYGEFKLWPFEKPSILAFTKVYKSETLLVILNMGDEIVRLQFSQNGWIWLLGNYVSRPDDPIGELHMRKWEAGIWRKE